MTQAFPLNWPHGWPRTPPSMKQGSDKFFTLRDAYSPNGNIKERRRVTFAEARDKLYTELEKLRVDKVIISSNHPPNLRGQMVESRTAVADEAVAVYFRYKKRDMVMACDRYETAAGNMRSLGLAIDAMRQLERHGGGTMMERAFEGFVALPAPERHWTAVLGVELDTPLAQVEDAYKRLARKYHPDNGGSPEKMTELNVARDRAIAAVT